MKKFFVLIIVISFLSISLYAVTSWSSREVTFSWDYNINDETTNASFNLRASTNINNIMPWPILTNITITNRSIKLMLVPNRYFFYLTASNFWGESDPSNIVDTPKTVNTATNLNIKRF